MTAKQNENVADFEYVMFELANVDVTEILKNNRLEALASLPHPSGEGQIMCGLNVLRRLKEMAKRNLAYSRYAEQVDVNRVFNHLKQIMVTRFLKEMRELNQKEADRAVYAAIKLAANTRETLIHYLPCHIDFIDSPSKFALGPVLFRPHKIAFEQLQPIFRNDIDRIDEDEKKETRQKHIDDIRRHYKSFSWVAEIRIIDCDQPTSTKAAEHIVQRALDCLHVLVGAKCSSHMRVGGPVFNSDRRAHFSVGTAGGIATSWSVDWLANHLGDGWWDWLNGDGDGEGKIVGLMNTVLEFGAVISKPAPLATRILDAAAWYGDASRETFPASRIVKYVTAIERVLISKNEENLSVLLTKRGAAILHFPGRTNLNSLEARFKNIYNLRSKLVHGSQSPLSLDLGKGLAEAEELSQRIILSAIQHFSSKGLKEASFTDQQFDEAYERITKWADNNRSNLAD